MAAQRDYYEVLGVPRDADAKTIKSAFRRLARRYHPDTSSEPDAQERFREVAEAYSVLSDPDKRARYDARGFAGVGGQTPEDVWGGIDFSDVFGAGAPVFGGLFDRLFGRAAAARAPARGADVQVAVTVPLRLVLTGGRRTVTLPRQAPCPVCSGSGARPGTAPRACPACGGTGQRVTASRRGTVLVQQVTACPDCAGRGTVIDEPCPACQGTGRSEARETVTIRVPPGLPEGAVLRLAGHGMPAPEPGGRPGDAYVIVRTRADPRLRRDGPDLWHELHVPVPDAALGVTAEVPTLDGSARIVVPAGTQPGTVLRVPGKGLPRHRGHGRGDLNVRVVVEVPRRLTPRERELYELLRTAGGTR